MKYNNDHKTIILKIIIRKKRMNLLMFIVIQYIGNSKRMRRLGSDQIYIGLQVEQFLLPARIKTNKY